MERQYAVTVAGRQAGKVLVWRQGLYLHFSCRCRLSGDIMYRLVVSCGNVRENLGILIPKEDSFVLETQLAAKRLGKGEMSFSLVPKQESTLQVFVPISPEEPFAYISRLKRSFLTIQAGQPGILLEKNREL